KKHGIFAVHAGFLQCLFQVGSNSGGGAGNQNRGQGESGDQDDGHSLEGSTQTEHGNLPGQMGMDFKTVLHCNRSSILAVQNREACRITVNLFLLRPTLQLLATFRPRWPTSPPKGPSWASTPGKKRRDLGQLGRKRGVSDP